MPENTAPELVLHVNHWSLLHEADPHTEEGLLKHLEIIRDAGFDAYCAPVDLPDLKRRLDEFGLRFGGAFDAQSEEQFADKIAACLEIGNGPINCQLADHDTPVERAIELTIALMEESARQGAEVHLEVHRDTCTETPEKAYAIIEGVRAATGKAPRVNFDFSHPAIVKHLNPGNYIERLFEDVETFQQSTLWHIRPFNGHHCQIPITNGKGGYSPEYEDCRPFIRQALTHWLNGPRPGNAFWVMPEQGTMGYHLSCHPPVAQDMIAIGKDVQQMWAELTRNR
jgi:hypothetical protein